MQMYHFNIIQPICLYLQTCFWNSRMFRKVVDVQCDHEGGKTVFESVERCSSTGRQNHVVLADLDGTLTRSSSPFPYFMLVAIEAGSPLRGLILLLFWPLAWIMQTIVSEAAGIHILIFISMAGLKASDVEGVGRAVLCRFYLEDLHPHSYKVFLSCGKRCVVTANPRIMVESFLKEYFGVELVIGTELHTIKGFCTGLLKSPGVLVGLKKRDAVKKAFTDKQPDVGLGDHPTDYAFLSLCKEGYIITQKQVEAVPREDYMKPLIFHDGRLAMRPTPMASLFIFLWCPIGFVLAILRFTAWIVLPKEVSVPLASLLGVKVRIRGSPPLPKEGGSTRGMLYVCTHRTLLDPIMLSVVLRRRITAVTYSLSRVSEVLSPIKTVRLTRCREEDAKTIEGMLGQGDLIICPEGTTCREPYLLRFSPLFAEITNDIVPVCTHVHMSLFHGTTARGFKGMDPFYFLMNPTPMYTVTILDPLPKEETCASGKSSFHVANHIQKLMGLVTGYECTNLTRKDKYRILAGNDGIVLKPPPTLKKKISINNKHMLNLRGSFCNFYHSLTSRQG